MLMVSRKDVMRKLIVNAVVVASVLVALGVVALGVDSAGLAALAEQPGVVLATEGAGDFVASGSLAESWDAPTDGAAVGELATQIAEYLVGGSPAASGAYPWMTFLVIEDQWGGFSQCGGSLIAPLWVLTAAHCVEDAAAIGTITGRTAAPTSLSDPAFVFAARTVTNAGYVPALFGVGDVALVELREANSAQTINLATPSDSQLYTAGTMATLAGWGVTAVGAPTSPVLLAGEMPIRSSADCTIAYPTFDPTFNTCAGYSGAEATQPVGSCSGDSGGPLFVRSAGTQELMQVGIVSYGVGQCTSLTYPGVYMRVSAFYDGIADFVGGLPAIDAQSPLWSVPADITVEATGSGGAVVNYTATASDNVGVASSSCAPPSGLSFSIGTTTVICTATDAAGNIGTATFKVTITPMPTFVPLTPARVLDTRASARVGSAAGTGTPLTLTLSLFGKAGLPSSGIGAVALNVTVAAGEDPTIGGGFVTVYPCGTSPDASNLNFTTGQTIPNSVIAPLSATGTVCFYVYGTAHLLADVSGYFPAGSGFTSLTPARILNTRNGAKAGNAAGTAAPYVLKVTGQGGVPASGVGAVALNVTVTQTENPTVGGGFVTVYPCGTRPDASNLNFTTGQTIPNSVIAPVSASGEVCFYVYGTTHLLADVSGYFPT